MAGYAKWLTGSVGPGTVTPAGGSRIIKKIILWWTDPESSSG
jgi:hypothetical protein